MRVLNVCLLQPKPILMPSLDRRVLDMVSDAHFYPQVASFAKEVQSIAEDRWSESQHITKLSQHPLVRAIGFKDSLQYLADVHRLLSTAPEVNKSQRQQAEKKSFLAKRVRVETIDNVLDFKELNKLTERYLHRFMTSTRQYASYQLKTARKMRREHPDDCFILNVKGDMHSDVENVARLYEDHDGAIKDIKSPWAAEKQNNFVSSRQQISPTLSKVPIKDIHKFNKISLPVIKKVLADEDFVRAVIKNTSDTSFFNLLR